jgi:hypothetical protein
MVGAFLGFFVGWGISYAIWGQDMWKWGTPSGLPMMFGAFILAVVGHALFDTPSEQERKIEESLVETMKAGWKGMLVGSGIGAAIGGLVAAGFLWPASTGAGGLLMVVALFVSMGGLVGFACGWSTNYKRPET